MRVDHRSLNVFVTQQFLDGAYVVTVLEKMGCKAVTKCVATFILVNSCEIDGILHCSLQVFRSNMMPPLNSGPRIS